MIKLILPKELQERITTEFYKQYKTLIDRFESDDISYEIAGIYIKLTIQGYSETEEGK